MDPGSDLEEGTSVRWRLQLLGAPRLSVGSTRVRLEHRAAAALAYVALARSATKRNLAALLWPDTSGPQLLNNLRHLHRRLRVACGGEPVLAHGEAVDRLVLASGGSCDLAALREALPFADAGALLQGQGELLEGLHFGDQPELERWLSGARITVATWQRAWLHAELQRREQAQDLGEALRLASAWLQQEPESDRAAHAVMRLHAAVGDRRAALDVYARFRAHVARKLEVLPSSEVAALAASLRRAGACCGP
jgi:DNA-binding SARP family transcriptional activator